MRSPNRFPWSVRTVALLVAAPVLIAGSPTGVAGQSPDEVMGAMNELGIEFVGIASTIPDRQNIGRREPSDDQEIVYAWDAESTSDDRVAREHLLSAAHLQMAGIPAVEGESPNFESGMTNQRYRLGGILTSIDIRGEVRYEVRLAFDWKLYDTRSSSFVWEGSSRSMQRGAVLGDRGEPDNVLLNATLDALDKVLAGEIPGAIGD